MKPLFFILFTLTSSCLFAAAEVKTEPKKSEVIYGGVEINSTLAKMLEVNGVKPIYEQCKKDNSGIQDNIPGCIWDKIKDNKAMKTAVQEIYLSEVKAKPEDKVATPGRAPASTKTSLINREQNITTNYNNDPAVAALSNFYQSKLDEILDPEKALGKEQAKGKILSVDHKQFIDLYKTELGKTIISAFTSYCLDTDASTCCDKADAKECTSKMCTIDQDSNARALHRKANLDSINNGTMDFKPGSPDFTRWTNCIVSVPEVCNSTPKDETKESIKRACLIVDYVKSARKNIQVADKQKEFYTEIASQGGGIATNMASVSAEKKATDTILEMTSADVKRTLKDTDKTALDAIDKCVKDGAIADQEACKKLLNTNKDESTNALAEFGMRQYAQADKLKEELEGDPDKVKDYLKEEGYSDKDIKELTTDEKTIEATRKQIIDRFTNQKAAIIKEMAERINKTTSTSDGKIEGQNDKDVTKINTIRQEIAGRATDMENLVKFNNVVSSYLTIDSGGGKLERNTASLFAETNSMDQKEAKPLQDQIKAAELKDKKNSADLNVNTINESFLKYKKD